MESFLSQRVVSSQGWVLDGPLSIKNLSLRLMKVRLTADMLRIRLDQPDVDTLSSAGTVSFVLSLGADEALQCTLRVEATANSIRASLTGNEITVTLPADRATRWMTSDAISLEGQVEAKDATTRILVEKDLGCRHTDDASDTASSTFDHLRV